MRENTKPRSVKILRFPTPERAAPAQHSVAPEAPATPADLAAVVAAWPILPDALKAGIVAMVAAAGKGGK